MSEVETESLAPPRESGNRPRAPRTALVFWLMKAGVPMTSLALWLLALAIAERTDFGRSFENWIAPAFMCVFLFVLGIVAYYASSYAMKHGTTPWFQFYVGLTLF